jgi:hypothetical protein
VEWWILWRRIAGGLTAGQQQSLSGPVAASLKEWAKSDKPRGQLVGPQELVEQCRLLGSLEWLPPAGKESLGRVLLEIAARPKSDTVRSAALWAVGRLGGRRPVYGPLNAVVAPEVAADWLRRVMQLPGTDAMESFSLMQLARKTGDRYRDIDEALRADVLKWMDRLQSPKTLRRLVREVGTLEAEDQGTVFGEALPRGLRIL